MRARPILLAILLVAIPAAGRAQGSPSAPASVPPSGWSIVPLGPAFERSCVSRMAAGSDGSVVLMTFGFPIPPRDDTTSPGVDRGPATLLWTAADGQVWGDGSGLVERPVLALDGTPLAGAAWSGRALVSSSAGMFALGQSVSAATTDYGAPIVSQAMSDGSWQVIEQDLPAELLIASAIVDRGRTYVAGRSGRTSPTDEPPRLYTSLDGHVWDDLGVSGAPGAATSIAVGADGTILLTGPRTSETGGSVGTWTRTPDGTWHDVPIATALAAPSVRSPIATSTGYLLSVIGYGETIAGELWGSVDGIAWQRQPADAVLGPVGSLRVASDGIEATAIRNHPDAGEPGSGSIATVLARSSDGRTWSVDPDEVPVELYPPIELADGTLLAAGCDLEEVASDDAHAMPGSLWIH